MIWRDMWPLEFAVYDDKVLFLRVEDTKDQVGYMLPMGLGLEQALSILDTFHPGQKQFYYVAQAELETLQSRYGKVDAQKQRSAYDYLYDAFSIAALKGRKLHGQRNHRNYFERTWAYHFEEITSTNVKDVRGFIESTAESKSSVFFLEGHRKTLEVLDNLDIYEFVTLALYAEGKVVGCTFGTLVGDTLFVTIEQANRGYRGAYPKLASEFASTHLDAGILFVNREDDLGNESLRESKLAWKTIEIIEKFSVTVE